MKLIKLNVQGRPLHLLQRNDTDSYFALREVDVSLLRPNVVLVAHVRPRFAFIASKSSIRSSTSPVPVHIPPYYSSFALHPQSRFPQTVTKRRNAPTSAKLVASSAAPFPTPPARSSSCCATHSVCLHARPRHRSSGFLTLVAFSKGSA